jgi:REP element-mobilizing transposase RayT
MARVEHVTRPAHRGRHPVHVTLRSQLRCLRAQFVFPTVRLTLRSLRERQEVFRVVHFSVQANHLHLLVEAADKVELSSGLRSLAIRLALRVNRLLMRRGKVWADRSHQHTLTTPRAVRHALVYVLANFRKHAVGATGLDRCSSAAYFTGFRDQPCPPQSRRAQRAPPGTPLFAGKDEDIPVSLPRSWLLANGWKRHGLICVYEAPAR